jgi:hypothetical protein
VREFHRHLAVAVNRRRKAKEKWETKTAQPAKPKNTSLHLTQSNQKDAMRHFPFQ